MEEPLRIIAATQGSYILNDTSEFTGSFDGIVVLEDTIISSIIIDGAYREERRVAVLLEAS